MRPEDVLQAPSVPRTLRVAELVKETLGEMLAQGKLKDPRITAGLVTITKVEVSGDLRIATVSVIVHGADDRLSADVIKGLASAAGVIRRSIGGREGSGKVASIA